MELISDIIKTDISFVKFFGEFILIGNGYYLYMYSKKENVLKKKMYVFDEHIFGIDINENKMLIYGGRYLKLYQFDFMILKFKEIASHDCSDWILTAKFLNSGSHVVIITMHNIVTLFDILLHTIETKECTERCISYCTRAVNNSWNNLIILSGTVFSQILLWWPTKSSDKLCPVIYRLVGHKGVVFCIDYDQRLNVICTTSDDRTAKIWSVKEETLGKELSQSSVNIPCVYTLTGHTARVFKCKLLKDTVITGGEDGIINVWSAIGEIVRRIDVHQGGAIWCLDCCEETGVIVSGGGDSGVVLLKLDIKVSRSQLATYDHENPRKVLILSTDSLIYLTDDGLFIRYSTIGEIFTGIFIDDKLKSYGLVEKSPCGNFIALAGYHGNLHIYKNSHHLEYLFSCQLTTKERIFSIHWLSCSALLTCGLEGVITLWKVSTTTMFPIHFWQLPPSKERWSTAACLCGIKSVLVGDRRGALYLYSMHSSEPVQIIKRAHNYLGVTYLCYNNGKVLSLGRNSTINEYKMDDENIRITQISSHKVSFTWLAGLYRKEPGDVTLLTGFSGTKFVLYDYMSRRTLLEIECGGGHRSWDFQIVDDQLMFCYIKEKKINVIRCALPDIIGTNIIKGFHLNETNVLKCIKFDRNDFDKCVFVSGGEDTVIRFSSVDFRDTSSDFKHLHALKHHLSSIRTITVAEIAEGKYYMFSGGGRAQVILWQLSIDVQSKSLVNCSEKYNYYEKSDNKDESETRVMALCTIAINNATFLLSGYSDGIVKVFKVDVKSDDELQLLFINQLAVYKSKCIFQLSVLSRGNYHLLVTMGSDGFIVFTDITQIFSDLNSTKNTSDWHNIAAIKAHQSGINSFASWDKSTSEVIYLTGGDDAAIVLNAFKVSCGSNAGIEHIASYHEESYHGAQVTGAYINENYFLTASVDQKVLLFKWDLTGDKFNVECLQEYSSSICDIKGIQCVPWRGCTRIFVYGRGCEVINCSACL